MTEAQSVLLLDHQTEPRRLRLWGENTASKQICVPEGIAGWRLEVKSQKGAFVAAEVISPAAQLGLTPPVCFKPGERKLIFEADVRAVSSSQGPDLKDLIIGDWFKVSGVRGRMEYQWRPLQVEAGSITKSMSGPYFLLPK